MLLAAAATLCSNQAAIAGHKCGTCHVQGLWSGSSPLLQWVLHVGGPVCPHKLLGRRACLLTSGPTSSQAQLQEQAGGSHRNLRACRARWQNQGRGHLSAAPRQVGEAQQLGTCRQAAHGTLELWGGAAGCVGCGCSVHCRCGC